MRAQAALGDRGRLRFLKGVHSAIWALFAGCVLAIPVMAWIGDFRAAFMLIAVVAVECAVLALNGGECPLQRVAARYTSDRRPNFDIYLPQWLAGRTKIIFGPLYAFGLIATLALWWMRG